MLGKVSSLTDRILCVHWSTFTSFCSKRGILPDADDQWQSATRVWSLLIHHWGNQQHHLWIHPEKHRKYLLSSPSEVLLNVLLRERRIKITDWSVCFMQDIFAVAVSLITGKIVYISDQAASILNCKREVFNNAKFVEFLTPQDVSVFYSFTTPYRLPSWSMCTGAGTIYLLTQIFNIRILWMHRIYHHYIINRCLFLSGPKWGHDRSPMKGTWKVHMKHDLHRPRRHMLIHA